MTTRKINRIIIKKDGKVYSFRCSASDLTISMRESDYVFANLHNLFEGTIIILKSCTDNLTITDQFIKRKDLHTIYMDGLNQFGRYRSFFIYDDLGELETSEL